MNETHKNTSRIIPVARTLLGLVFVVFGLNGFFHFIPAPPPPPAVIAFFGGLFGPGYFLPLLKGTEIVAGALLLSNRLVPLALTLLAPIIVNIVAFHAFLAPSGLPLGLFVLTLELFLAYAYAEAFRPMLAVRVEPRALGKRAALAAPAR